VFPNNPESLETFSLRFPYGLAHKLSMHPPNQQTRAQEDASEADTLEDSFVPYHQCLFTFYQNVTVGRGNKRIRMNGYPVFWNRMNPPRNPEKIGQG
jgi:hypothetical protein